VTEFYRRAFADEVLGPIFVDVARVDPSAHLPVMGDFWDTVLLRAGVYHRNALRPHLALAAEVELTDAHFARWLALWTATVDERHTGPRAELAKTQAARIAGSIRRRLHDARASVSTTIQPRHPPGGML
jgi:hemoglobin